jgi:hypothetical protein
MKIIDFSREVDQGRAASVIGRLFATLKAGRTTPEAKAQENLAASLEPLLDNRYTLIRQTRLQGLDIPIPLVLVGPTGAYVLYPCMQRGFFRIRVDTWEQLDDGQDRFRPVKPNILTRTTLMARAVAAFLMAEHQPLPEVEPVVVFTNPGTHAELIKPALRIVMVDGINRFVSAIHQSREYLDKSSVQKIVDLLCESTQPGYSLRRNRTVEDAFSLKDPTQRAQVSDLVDKLPRGERVVKTLNKIPFSTGQWILLSLLVIVNIVILVGFVLLILFTS